MTKAEMDASLAALWAEALETKDEPAWVCPSCGGIYANATLLTSHSPCPGRAERLRELRKLWGGE